MSWLLVILFWVDVAVKMETPDKLLFVVNGSGLLPKELILVSDPVLIKDIKAAACLAPLHSLQLYFFLLWTQNSEPVHGANWHLLKQIRVITNW